MTPPPEIAEVPGLEAVSMSVSGVYFLCRRGKVVYVGQSTNVYSRLASHSVAKRHDAAYFIRCAPEALSPLEQHWIKALQPEENRTHIARTTQYARDAAKLEAYESLRRLKYPLTGDCARDALAQQIEANSQRDGAGE